MAEHRWPDPVQPPPATTAPVLARTPALLTFTINPTHVREHEARSGYAEEFWLPVVGPSSLWLLRWLEREMAATAGITHVHEDILARSLGTPGNGGRHSPLRRTLARLVQFHLMRTMGAADPTLAASFVVPVGLPFLSERQVARLPDYLAQRHERVHQCQVRA